MVNKQENLELAKDIFLKGEEKLKSAELLLKHELYDDCVSRIYYAVYFFTKSLLFLLGEESRTYKGMISIFGLKVIKMGLIDKKFGSILSNLHEKRERGDYSIYSFLDLATTQKLFQDAIIFKKEIRKILKDKFNLSI
ncbi:MAG: HEPN domain-containing protein [Promethearchaeota archaeon]